jgi:hypothetical protein
MMTATEILTEIRHLPLSEKQTVFKTLAVELKPKEYISEEERLEREFEQMLLQKGVIKSIPSKWNEDDDFEPIEFTGKPISETIIEDRV